MQFVSHDVQRKQRRNPSLAPMTGPTANTPTSDLFGFKFTLFHKYGRYAHAISRRTTR